MFAGATPQRDVGRPPAAPKGDGGACWPRDGAHGAAVAAGASKGGGVSGRGGRQRRGRASVVRSWELPLQRCFGSPPAAPRGVGGACCGLGTARVVVRCLRVYRREAGGMSGEGGGGGVASWALFQRPKPDLPLSRPRDRAGVAPQSGVGRCEATAERMVLWCCRVRWRGLVSRVAGSS